MMIHQGPLLCFTSFHATGKLLLTLFGFESFLRSLICLLIFKLSAFRRRVLLSFEAILPLSSRRLYLILPLGGGAKTISFANPLMKGLSTRSGSKYNLLFCPLRAELSGKQ